MQFTNNHIGVEFDENHNKVHNMGGIEIVRPDMWEFEQSGADTKYQKNTNLKDVNPQIAKVVFPNRKIKLATGEKIFTHFLAIDNADDFEIHGKKCKVIPLSSIFFRISEDGNHEMMEDVYLGEQVYSDGIQTKSGIWITPYDKKKESLKVKLTHVPKNSPYFSVGDTVLTVDDFQYEIDLDGKTYIKLNTWHIAVKIEEE